jgi:N-hydroxyarylamine O-acetyltransferase
MNIQHYLERIHFTKTVEISKSVLFELQRLHLKHIPFENLDIHYNSKINLDVTAFYTKIITQKRGGFCYELNGLFYQLLKEIGFKVKMISAKVYSKDKKYGQEYDHLTIMATINNQDYLVDVGFGQFTHEPLKFSLNNELIDDFGTFQFDKFDSNYFRINEMNNNTLTPIHIFKTTARQLVEFKNMCHYHQTSTKSHFTKKKVITKLTENGRVTLNNDLLKITNGTTIKEVRFKETEKFEFYLKKYFDLEIENNVVIKSK